MSNGDKSVLLVKDGELIYLADVNFGGLARDSTLQETNSILNGVAKDTTLNNLIDFLKNPYSSVFKKYDVTQDLSDTIVDSANCVCYLKMLSTLLSGDVVVKIGDVVIIDVELKDVSEIELSNVLFSGSGSISIEVSNVSGKGRIYIWLSYR